MTEPARKKAHVVTGFTDIGTGERHEAGDTPMLTLGAYGNYEAAGLVRAPTAERKATAASAKSPAKPKAKARSKSTRKAAQPATKSTAPAASPPATATTEEIAPSA